MLAIILGIKEKFFLENEQDFNEFVQILYKNDLFKNIEKILKISKDYGDILHVARISRNEIVHELTKSLEVTIDLVPKDIIKNFDTRLIKLIEKISIGDLITSLLLSFNTNEQIPNTKFLNNYRNNILVWVIDRSE
ncbi:hypothetical protein [Clostridium sp.]|uniref:hypothetical protein n=1 Tax=Clostridium sp. TaxID=1506 RepID=UPI00284BFA6C|nr:hypothetical protein [Clostridium sp.]MDR3598782.1 hypothetical protein [Clostridium sp.]